ncbi:major facilitator superfamily domain-containing protein [Aspergillus alliaceus]|uniref:Major facilitator superfamily domain-containing protein n=1 Tax=Petromyces alliaceus TaxID=209559 RepID=A0A5N7C1D9_PETAA|nr:major facilitator superfamily domain-containing protein [Aspergillus alliaceus]
MGKEGPEKSINLEDNFLVEWSEDDPSNPRNLSLARRWLIVLIVSTGSLCVQLYGRRIIYLMSFTLFLIWLIPCAVATNIQTMIIARFFNGLSGSAFLSVAGGTVGDVFHRHELAAPMMLYTASPFVGPELGPLLLERKTMEMRKTTGDDRWQTKNQTAHRPLSHMILQSIYRPLMLLALEPMCLNLCIFSAILLGIIYLFFGAFDQVFTNVYGMTLWQCGCCFLGMFVGMMIAVLSDPIWRRVYGRLESKHRERTDNTEKFLPEWRLPPAIAGAPMVTIGLFIFAWTIYPDVHWIAPIIGSALFGFGTVLIFSGIFTFLVEAYPTYAASALAANSFARCILGGAFPLFGVQMYDRLGYHWATTLLAFLTLIMAPFPYIFFHYGPRIRLKSQFAKRSSSA